MTFEFGDIVLAGDSRARHLVLGVAGENFTTYDLLVTHDGAEDSMEARPGDVICISLANHVRSFPRGFIDAHNPTALTKED